MLLFLIVSVYLLRCNILLCLAILKTNSKWAKRMPKIQLAGSVMPHIPESRIYYKLLQSKCDELMLNDVIEFIISPTEEEKFSLYRKCDTTLYTPELEHFGIVPIEALEQRRPVIVIDSGGPAETVIEDITGTKVKILLTKILLIKFLLIILDCSSMW